MSISVNFFSYCAVPDGHIHSCWCLDRDPPVARGLRGWVGGVYAAHVRCVGESWDTGKYVPLFENRFPRGQGAAVVARLKGGSPLKGLKIEYLQKILIIIKYH